MTFTSYAPTHVLIAEDDPTLRAFFVALLERAQYRVTAVADGAQALERLRARDIHLVLSDIGLPGLSGIQLLEEARKLNQNIQVVLITGNPNLETAMNAVEGRAAGYLSKFAPLAKIIATVKVAEEWHKAGVVYSEAEAEAKRFALAGAMESLYMEYQPIVSLQQRAVYAYEALARNDHPILRNPLELFKQAAQLSKLEDLGRTVRNKIAAKVPSLPNDVSVFVNLLTDDLLDRHLYDAKSPLTKHAKRVVLEITEQRPLSNVDSLQERLSELRTLGFRFAVDDIGQGNSGISSVFALRPEVVKLDMSLVRDIDKVSTNQQLLAGLNSFLKAANAKVLAEGIETHSELTTLNKLRIDLYQGYYFGKPAKQPVPPELNLYDV